MRVENPLVLLFHARWCRFDFVAYAIILIIDCSPIIEPYTLGNLLGMCDYLLRCNETANKTKQIQDVNVSGLLLYVV